MCAEPCSSPIISWITKLMTGFRLYPTIDIEHYQLMRLHGLVVNFMDYGVFISVLCNTKLLSRMYYVTSHNP